MNMKTLHDITKWCEANGFEAIIEGQPDKLTVVKCITHEGFEKNVWAKISDAPFNDQTVDGAFQVLADFLSDCGLNSQAFMVLAMQKMVMQDTLREIVVGQVQKELSAK